MDTRALGCIEHGLHGPRNAGLLGEARRPMLREGMESIADGLDTTAKRLGNLGWGLLLCAGQ
jgi:hypothetical protein